MDFRTRSGCPCFHPVSDLIPAYESLSATFLPDELPILHYFESTWIEMGLELEDYDEIMSSLTRFGMSWIATRGAQK